DHSFHFSSSLTNGAAGRKREQMRLVTYRCPSSPNAKSPSIRSLRRYLGGMGGTTPLDIIVSFAIGALSKKLRAHKDQTIASFHGI
ncbi:hypothetical protein AVEN_223013-1, partial [Araneus ventricosus]